MANKNRRKALKLGLLVLACLSIAAFAIPLGIFLRGLQEREALLTEFRDLASRGIDELKIAVWNPESGIRPCASLRAEATLADLAELFSHADDNIRRNRSSKLEFIMTITSSDGQERSYMAEIYEGTREDVLVYKDIWIRNADGGWNRGGGQPIRIPGAGRRLNDLYVQSQCGW